MTFPSPAAPSDPDLTGDERTLLTQFLDYQRTVMLRKVGELDDASLRKVMTPTGLTLLGMLKHLAYVERWWFRVVFAGEQGIDPPWTDADPDADCEGPLAALDHGPHDRGVRATPRSRRHHARGYRRADGRLDRHDGFTGGDQGRC